MSKDTEEKVIQSKSWRQRLDSVLQEMKNQQVLDRANKPGEDGRHLALSITHLEDAIMRQGMRMKSLNEQSPGSAPNPYPTSYDPSTPQVEPTADGLKL